MLSNTSQIDVERFEDVANNNGYDTQFPEFKSVPFHEFILEEGEMLYIPPKHWHYVRALETSFSVSFWWK